MDIEFVRSEGPRARPLAQERETCFLLVDQGTSFVEAATAVDISTRTGGRWRNGRGASGRFKAAPPLNAAPVDESSDPSRYRQSAPAPPGRPPALPGSQNKVVISRRPP
ncbi:hypothetical protein GCM10010385_60540 [Streptomyces geysiriensis]|nr:hypothetical protein GCM10010385_60540 [Streptomyces geysiriensis]GGZ57399.1 hypothetical protein GCM10010301_32540 [Streptomyces plicatus]